MCNKATYIMTGDIQDTCRAQDIPAHSASNHLDMFDLVHVHLGSITLRSAFEVMLFGVTLAWMRLARGVEVDSLWLEE